MVTVHEKLAIADFHFLSTDDMNTAREVPNIVYDEWGTTLV
jgi:hypothetical protein